MNKAATQIHKYYSAKLNSWRQYFSRMETFWGTRIQCDRDGCAISIVFGPISNESMKTAMIILEAKEHVDSEQQLLSCQCLLTFVWFFFSNLCSHLAPLFLYIFLGKSHILQTIAKIRQNSRAILRNSKHITCMHRICFLLCAFLWRLKAYRHSTSFN